MIRWGNMLFSLEIGFSWKPGACTNIVMCINFKSQEKFEMYHSWISQASYVWKNKEKDIWEAVEIYLLNTERSPMKHLSCKGSDNIMKFGRSDFFKGTIIN